MREFEAYRKISKFPNHPKYKVVQDENIASLVNVIIQDYIMEDGFLRAICFVKDLNGNYKLELIDSRNLVIKEKIMSLT